MFPWIEKVLRGKHFADVEEVKQKTSEALKGIKIAEFKNCFEQWKKVLIGVLHQVEGTFKVTDRFKHVKLNTQFFINKFCFLGAPPCMIPKNHNLIGKG